MKSDYRSPEQHRKRAAKRYSASQSFTHSEVTLLDFITSGLLTGKDIKMVTRHKDFANLVRKVQTMKARLNKLKAEREAMLARKPVQGE